MGQLHQSTERNGQRCGPPETTQKDFLSGEEVHAVSTAANVCDRSDVSQDPDFLSSLSMKHITLRELASFPLLLLLWLQIDSSSSPGQLRSSTVSYPISIEINKQNQSTIQTQLNNTNKNTFRIQRLVFANNETMRNKFYF